MGFDLETSGTDTDRDCVVTAAAVRWGGGMQTAARTWVAVPEVDIPAEAAAVHGWTTEAAREPAPPAAVVVDEIVSALAAAVAEGWPLVVMNAPFDLTLLDRTARRLGVVPLVDRAAPYVLDPQVLDKQVDRFRAGRRRLVDLCGHWCVKVTGPAHDARVDAVAACDVVYRIAKRHTWLAKKTLAELHAAQTRWAFEQSSRYRDYVASIAGREDEAAAVRLDWPMVPVASQPVSGDDPLTAPAAADEVAAASLIHCPSEGRARLHVTTADGRRRCRRCGHETDGIS
jgi:DNA polymerase-3 subunit epsilon